MPTAAAEHYDMHIRCRTTSSAALKWVTQSVR